MRRKQRPDLYYLDDGRIRFSVKEWLKTPGMLIDLPAYDSALMKLYANTQNQADWLGDTHEMFHMAPGDGNDIVYFIKHRRKAFQRGRTDIEAIFGNEVVWDIKWVVKHLPESLWNSNAWRCEKVNNDDTVVYPKLESGLRDDADSCVQELAKIATWVTEGAINRKVGMYTDGFWMFGGI